MQEAKQKRGPKEINPTRRVFHVELVQDRLWQVKEEGTSHVSRAYVLKDEAVDEANRLGRACESSRVIVHNPDGSVEQEMTYGAEPQPSRRD